MLLMYSVGNRVISGITFCETVSIVEYLPSGWSNTSTPRQASNHYVWRYSTIMVASKNIIPYVLHSSNQLGYIP